MAVALRGMRGVSSKSTLHRLAVAASVIATVVAVALAGPSHAGPATDQLRPAIDQGLRVLDDPALKSASMTRERRAAIRRVMDGAQFNTIVQTASFAELLRRIRARLVELTAPAPSAAIR